MGMIMRPSADENALGDWQDRLDRLIGPLCYVALLIATALALLIPVPNARPAAVLPAAAAAFLWLVLRSVLDRRPGPDGRARYAGAHFAVLLALITVLVLDNPIFGFFAFTGYLHAAQYLRGRARMAGAAVGTVPTSLSQVGGVLPDSLAKVGGLLAVVAFNLMVVGLMFALNEAADRLSARRKAANAELAEANRLLTETLAENAGLHAQLLVQAREAGAGGARPAARAGGA
ncbi:hypothetical protein ACFV6I_03055, partial [Kitasatospora sp. NPDC059803]